jgi:exonuclease SbcC
MENLASLRQRENGVVIRRIKLTNYMSHEQTVIEPADGLTVLIGENNSGKSAIVSALQTLCHNASGNYMERHGTRECIVEIETDAGDRIQWRRIKGKVSYEINGKTQDRLKGSVPDDLHSLLRMPSVAAGNETFDIHFGEQKDPIFLLNRTSSSRAAFFASSSDAAKLIQMQSRHRDKVRERNSELRTLEKRELKLNQRREELQGVAALELQLESAEALYATIQTQHAQMLQLDLLLQQIDHAQSSTQQLAAKAALLAALQPPPELLPTESLSRLLDASQRCQAARDHAQEICRALAELHVPPPQQPVVAMERLLEQFRNATGNIEYNSARSQSLNILEKPPQLVDCQPLKIRIQELTQLAQQVQQQQSLLKPLSNCPAPPALTDLRELQRTMQAIQQAARELERAKVASKAIQTLASPPLISNVTPLASTISTLEQRQKTLAEYEDAFDAITTALKEAEADLKHCADENETCPLCGQELDAETLVAKAMVQGGDDE